MNKGLNWIMMVSLVLAFASGIALKAMPGMWPGIVHGVSGLVLVVSVLVHVFRRPNVRCVQGEPPGAQFCCVRLRGWRSRAPGGADIAAG